MATDSRLEAMESEIIVLRNDLRMALTELEGQKAVFTDSINLTFAQHKITMNEIIEDAKKEFALMRSNFAEMFSLTEQHLTTMNERIKSMEQQNTHSNTDKVKGYLPQKHIIPKIFTDKVEEWRTWQEDVEEYFDSVNPGMKELLQDIDKAQVEVNEGWRDQRELQYSDLILKDHIQIYRTLKHSLKVNPGK